MSRPSSRRSRLALAAPALAALAAVATACGTGGGADDTPPVATTEVEVVDNAFAPTRIQVAAGETVTWTWAGSQPHDVVGDDFSSEIQRDGSFAHAFDEPGTYDYVCTVHPRMRASVLVVADGA